MLPFSTAVINQSMIISTKNFVNVIPFFYLPNSIHCCPTDIFSWTTSEKSNRILLSPWSVRWTGYQPRPSNLPTRIWWRGRAGSERCYKPSRLFSAPRGSWGWCIPERTSSPATRSTAASSWNKNTERKPGRNTSFTPKHDSKCERTM